MSSDATPTGEYLQYGGQAIIEGVMMRSPRYFSVACRAPNKEIVLITEAVEKTWIGRQQWLKLPFLRGSLALLDAMGLGVRAMRFASGIQLDPKYQDPDAKPEPQTSKAVQDIAVAGTMVVSLGLAFFVFNFLPNLLAEQSRNMGVRNGTAINYINETIKVIFFFGYIWAISFLPDIRRVFQYHGAEHKAINTLEAKQELTLENCLKQTRLHPRCGTSFAVIVLIVSFLFTPLVPRYPITGGVQGQSIFLDVVVRVFLELCFLPIIAGLSYEMLRFAGKFRNNALVDFLFKPGLMTQYITTREPDNDQVEVALLALQACLDAEMAHGKPATEVAEPAAAVS